MVRYIVSIRYFLTQYRVNKTLFDAYSVNKTGASGAMDPCFAAAGASREACRPLVTESGSTEMRDHLQVF